MDAKRIVTVVSFDIGMKNFAWCVESRDIDAASSTIINIDVVDLTQTGCGNETYDVVSRRKVLSFLDEKKEMWHTVDVVLVEQQYFNTFSKGRKRKGGEANVKAIKIAETVMTYFLLRFPFKEIIYYPSYNKTVLLGAPAKLTKPQRKKWSVEHTLRVLEHERKDTNTLDKLRYIKKTRKQKLDDVCDSFLQIQAWWKGLSRPTTTDLKV